MTTIELTREGSREYVMPVPAVQVKMFIHNNPGEAEKEISLWLKENDVIIQHVAQSQSEKGGGFVFVVSLFYLSNS